MVIKPVIEHLNWTCVRVDEVCQPTEIIDLIWEELHRSSIVIADLTDRNANVFYELGYAHALGRPSILLCQNINDVPFNLRHRQLLIYSPDETGQIVLKEKLKNYLMTVQ